jgi:hypothetical protein
MILPINLSPECLFVLPNNLSFDVFSYEYVLPDFMGRVHNNFEIKLIMLKQNGFYYV